MSATWCCAQPFGQPLILMWISRVSGSVMSIASITLLHGLVETHRARDAELARVGAGARHHVVDLARARRRRARARRARATGRTRSRGAPSAAGGSAARSCARSRPRGAHDLRQAAELLGREVAAGDLDLDASRSHPASARPRWPRGSVRTRTCRRWGCRSVCGGAGALLALVVDEQALLDREVAFVRPSRPAAPPRPAGAARRSRTCRRTP